MSAPLTFTEIDDLLETLSLLAYPNRVVHSNKLYEHYDGNFSFDLGFGFKYLQTLGFIKVVEHSGLLFPEITITDAGIQHRVECFIAAKADEQFTQTLATARESNQIAIGSKKESRISNILSIIAIVMASIDLIVNALPTIGPFLRELIYSL